MDKDNVEACAPRSHYNLTQGELDAFAQLVRDDYRAELLAGSGEPVAWITPDGEGFRIRFSSPVTDVPLGWQAIHTAAQRQPLTDEPAHSARSVCIKPACGQDCCDCNCAISKAEAWNYIRRYAYLRGQNLDAISAGGIFAGLTPDNVVLNGADLDGAVDSAIEAAHGIKEQA